MKRFTHTGLLAIDPRAMGAEYSPSSKRTELDDDQIAIVTIAGPLLANDDPSGCFDSYSAIKRRVQLALSACDTVILSTDSPGGMVAGCFDFARWIRAQNTAGKRILAHVQGQGTSAAFALAAACQRVYASESAMVGSIGVIESVVDLTANDAANGIRFEFLTSGGRKLDGNPHAPISDDALRIAQARVDACAGQFFDLVAEMRPRLTPAKLAALEAGVFLAREAKGLGLIDEVASLDDVIASLAATSPKASSTTPAPAVQVGAMAAIAGAPTMTSPPRPPQRATVAHSIPKPTAPSAQKAEPAMTAAQIREFNQRLDAIERVQREAIITEQRTAFFAARPHLPAYLVEGLAKEPMVTIRKVVGAWEGTDQPPAPGVAPSRLPPDQKRALDERMGIAAVTYSGAILTDHSVTLGAPASKFGSVEDRRGKAASQSRLPAAEKADLDRRMGITRQDGAHVINEPHRVVLGAIR